VKSCCPLIARLQLRIYYEKKAPKKIVAKNMISERLVEVMIEKKICQKVIGKKASPGPPWAL
jgi:hypothetical protein